MKAVNSSKSSRGLFCQLYNGELNKYIMKIADDYFARNPNARKNPQIAAAVHGCQRDGKTWVMNESCQIYYDGDQLDETQSKYVWMADCLPSKVLDNCRSQIPTPLDMRQIDKLLASLKRAVSGINIIFFIAF
jgi:hypothetical protein